MKPMHDPTGGASGAPLVLPSLRSRATRGAGSLVALAAALLLAALGAGPSRADYVNWEAGQVRPLALSPDGSRLLAVDTPDNQLAIFSATPTGLQLHAEVRVGLRPVAVAVRDLGGGDLEAWVVNHLSDSVSVVFVPGSDPAQSRVTRTLLVGDEPRDVVFGAGPRAFVTTARRGQHATVPPADLKVAGTPRALLWVFDADSPGGGLGGTPIEILELFTDTPRGLAVSADGSTVYAAGYRSGNRTTTISESTVNDGPGGLPMPPGATPGWPTTGLILKFDPDAGAWLDAGGRDWSTDVPFSLPDLDVFVIDATADPPALASGTSSIAGVGTTLFNLAVRPGSGKLYVSNIEARNHVRFENLVGATEGLQGHIALNRITVIDGSSVSPIHLNPHVDYSVASGPPGEIAQSLALPTEMVFDGSGSTVYVAAFGSAKVAVLDADALEAGTIGPDRIEVAGGPSGLALDELRDRLYVMTRFDNEIMVIGSPADPMARSVLAEVPLHTPEPPEVRLGRRFLYDATISSGHGDAACATCHPFGDMDKLAWDLGDPFGPIVPNPNTDVLELLAPGVSSGLGDFHPLKGPMTTQSLRGLPGSGPLHWRGDRTTIGDEFDFVGNLSGFNGAFVTLLGRPTPLPAADFTAFTSFVETLAYPPNPMKPLDDVGTASQQNGENLFTNVNTVFGFLSCEDCHTLPTGTDGLSLDVSTVVQGMGSQPVKVAHLRNMYDKVGAYGVAGPQVSGFGFLHDGGDWSMNDFLSIFNLSASQDAALDDFMMSVDTGFAPVVGQQVIATPANFADPVLESRVDLFVAEAQAGRADLVVSGMLAGERRGFVYGGGAFLPDRSGEPSRSAAELLTLASEVGQEQVFMAVPVGTGTRIGIDRDEDLFLDGEDNCPGVPNDQTDTDGDGLGDPCDATPVPEPLLLPSLLAALPLLRWMARRRRAT